MDSLPLRLFSSPYATLFSLRFLFLLLFTISISSLPPPSRACSEPFHCGCQTFPLPFREKNSGCGDPALQLDCDPHVNMPLLNITGYQFYVTHYHFTPSIDILYIEIVDKNMWGDNCDPSKSNHSMELWSNPHFRISEDNANVSLWGDCGKDVTNFLPGGAEQYALDCNKTWYLYPDSDLGTHCKSSVQLPVEKLHASYIQPFLPITYIKFKINWNLGEGCEPCESETKPARSIILGCSIGGGVLIAVIIVLIYFMRRRKRSSRRGSSSEFSNYEGSGIEKGEKRYMLGSNKGLKSIFKILDFTLFFHVCNHSAIDGLIYLDWKYYVEIY